MTGRTVGVVSPSGRVTTGPPPIHLPGQAGRTACGLTIGPDWAPRLIDHPRQTCRACNTTET